VDLNDDVKYQDVISTLKQMQQVKAPPGFEGDLMQKINSGQLPGEKTFWQNIIIPSRLIPSAALAVTAILLIFVLNNNGITQENPLLTVPREREDVIRGIKTSNIPPETKPVTKVELRAAPEISEIQKDAGNEIQNKPVEKTLSEKEDFSPSATVKISEEREDYSPSVKGKISGGTAGTSRFIRANSASGRINDYPVNKAGLNFRQINLSNEQKIELDQLKEKLDSTFNTREKK
jgi:hypothetical protein